MKYILVIGMDEYLLPDNRGLSTVMETLSKARTLSFGHRKYDDRNKLIGFRHGPAPAVEVRALTGTWNTVKASDNTVDCEVLPPVKSIGAPSRAERLSLIGSAVRSLPERAGGEA